MPSRCSPQTISSIIGSVLDSHSPSISSGSVLAAVVNSLSMAHPDPLTYGRRVVLADYIVDDVDHDSSTLPTIVKFIDESTRLRGEMVYCLFSAFSDVLSSPATPAHRRQVVTSIIKEFSIRYPDVCIEEGRVKLGWFRPLSNEDRVVHDLVMNLFSSASASSHSVQRYVSLLRQLSRAQPPVLIRHLSLIGSLLLSVARLPMRQLKSKYEAVLIFVLDLLLKVTPDAFEDASQIETILGSYFRIFDGIGRSRFWGPIVLRFEKICVRYLELSASRACTFFASHADVIRHLINSYESPAASILSDVLTSSTRFLDE
ncbi:unnamed protein product [Toxocara canis]|nr:unnamed protein product [Toxocara canis]